MCSPTRRQHIEDQPRLQLEEESTHSRTNRASQRVTHLTQTLYVPSNVLLQALKNPGGTHPQGQPEAPPGVGEVSPRHFFHKASSFVPRQVVFLMASRNPLRAVGRDEVSAPAHVKTVVEAAQSGTTKELLIATRDRIATAVENPNTAARDLASLTKRLMETVREIEAIDARDSQEASEDVEVSDGIFDASAV